VTPAGHEGTAALQALPNIGTNNNTGFETLSPRADYQVEFNRTGLHFVWIRGIGASGDDDSLHVGLDGVAQPDSDRITGFGSSLDWSNATMDIIVAIIDVPSTGLHTVNVWMREDGTVYDKLLLTSNPAYVPTGTGPPESPQVTPVLAAPTISPNGGFFAGSIGVTLSSIYPGATILYTADGTDPITSSTAEIYTGPLAVSATATVSAATTMSGFLDSDITARDFTETSCTISRIMPLGDSITEGVFGPVAAGPELGLRGGYRGPLYRSLVDNGYTVDFAGGLLAGGSLMPQIDPEHEGHSGWSDDQIAASVYSFLQNNPADIVLLHVGTNDFETSAADVGTILDEIDRFETDSGIPITVILAKIINRQTFHSPTSTFNANLEVLALARISAGDSIVLVDQENALTYPGDMFDNLHPNSTGYGKMSNVWFTALQSLMSPCGT
jgi:lysophospholipase L1-like esterase